MIVLFCRQLKTSQLACPQLWFSAVSQRREAVDVAERIA